MGAWLVAQWPFFVVANAALLLLGTAIAFLAGQRWKAREERRLEAKDEREAERHQLELSNLYLQGLAEMSRLAQQDTKPALEAAQARADAVSQEADDVKKRLQEHQDEAKAKSDRARLNHLRSVSLFYQMLFPLVATARRQIRALNEDTRKAHSITDAEVIHELAHTMKPATTERELGIRVVGTLTRVDLGLMQIAPTVMRWLELSGGLQAFFGDDNKARWVYDLWLAKNQRMFTGGAAPPSALTKINTHAELPEGTVAPLINGQCYLPAIDIVVERDKKEKFL